MFSLEIALLTFFRLSDHAFVYIGRDKKSKFDSSISI